MNILKHLKIDPKIILIHDYSFYCYNYYNCNIVNDENFKKYKNNLYKDKEKVIK